MPVQSLEHSFGSIHAHLAVNVIPIVADLLLLLQPFPSEELIFKDLADLGFGLFIRFTDCDDVAGDYDHVQCVT